MIEMKRYTVFLFAALALTFQACQEDYEPGGTAVKDMAGDWWVTYQNSVEEYYYLFGGIGEMPSTDTIQDWTWDYIYDDAHYPLTTYNTAADLSTEMFIDDAMYWEYKVKVAVDYAAKTFELPDGAANMAYDDCDITILKGRILKGAATSPSGTPVDSIVFYVKFSDDPYGFTYTKVSGYRYTGFPEDDPEE
jgi:hypothetical protein